MSEAALRWAGASTGSLLVHGAALAAALIALRPEPLPPQSRPRAELEIVSTTVRSEEAAPQTLPSESADDAEAAGMRVGGAEIPVTSAAALAPDQTAVRPATPAASAIREVEEATEIAALPPAGSKAVASEADVATRLAPSAPTVPATKAAPLPASVAPPAAALPTATPVASVAAEASRIGASPAPAIPLAPAVAADLRVDVSPADPVRLAGASAEGPVLAAAVPAGEPVESAATEGQSAAGLAAAGDRLEDAAPDTTRVASAPVEAPTAPAETLPATAGVAALGWSGDGATLDPLSVNAISAFMAPTTGGQSVRDGVAAALAAVPCARLQTAFDPATGALELRGHVPEEGLRATVTAALSAEVGGAIPIADRLRILPRPQCGVLARIDAVGLPQSDEQSTNPRIVGPDTHVREYQYAEGDRLVLDVLSPDYPAVVYVDYFDASGTVLHLQPNEIVPLERVDPDTPVAVGSEVAGRPSLALTIAPPFGQEIAVAFAASHPLYEGVRPISEPADAYLAFMQERVAEARATHPDFKGEWVYFFISTRGD